MPNFPDQYSLSKSQVHCSLKLLVNPFLINLIKKKKTSIKHGSLCHLSTKTRKIESLAFQKFPIF